MELDSINRVVFFSSGSSSWLAAKRVADKFGTDNLYLVFADTSIEDEDNYRFLVDAAQNVGGKLIWLKDGRTPWDIFFEKKFLNHRQFACSLELKIKPCQRWIKDCEFDPDNTILYFGIGFDEIERIKAISKNWQPFKVDTPLCWDDFGWADRSVVDAELKANNLKRPRLYDFGFAHANCGGFCPKAGMKHYRILLKTMPDIYHHHEQKEQEFRAFIGRNDIGILRKTVKGKTIAMTLKDWREQIETESIQMDSSDEALGGCGCFVDSVD